MFIISGCNAEGPGEAVYVKCFQFTVQCDGFVRLLEGCIGGRETDTERERERERERARSVTQCFQSHA